jgi:hypothetical protein
MDYPFTLPSHPELKLSLREGGLFTGPKILKDGVPLNRAKGFYLVSLADGSSLQLKIKIGLDLLTPKIEFAGKVIEVMPSLPGFWVAWAYIPLLLLFVGGAIGGLCGGAASYATLSTLRSDLPKFIRYSIVLIAPPLAFLAYFAAALLFYHPR